jgi:HK97 family phage major capsid protein
MGRIKELLEKKKAGTLTEEEVKELNELQTESKALDEGNGGEGGDDADEEKAVDELAQKLADQATARMEKGLEKILKGMESKSAPVQVTKEAKFVVDPKLGKKTVQELSEIKVALPNREDKQVKEVSMVTLHFISALMTGDVQKLQTLVEGTGSRGGFLVPEEFANMITEDIRDLTVMRQIADVMTTQSDTLHLPSLASRPKAAFRAEGAVKNTSTVDFGENVFTPYSLAAIVPLSNELVADATMGVNGSIVNYVAQLIERSLAEREEKAFWVGSGSGEPTGITSYSPRTVAASLTDASRADSLISAYIRTPQGYRGRGVWVMNSQALEKVHTLKDTQGNYLLSRLGDTNYPTLKGRPVYEQNDLPGGVAYFGDFSYYKIVDREGINVRVSDEATVAGQSGFERNLTFVRVEKRVDGELTLPAAITKVTGLGTP